MRLIVGLGNPGSQYAATRHNFGRRVVEFIAGCEGQKFLKQKPLKASTSSFDWEGHPVTLAFPEMFMNVSGEAVLKLVRHFKVDPAKDLLIVVDDFALPFGKFRLRSRGSSGGHNGLKSVEAALGTSHFSRLRVGIDAPAQGSIGEKAVTDYVLAPFSNAEKKALEKILQKGHEACQLWVCQSLSAAMNAINPGK